MARRRSKTLESELVNFKSFQDSQIDILKGIADSLGSNLNISTKLEDNLSKLSNQINSMLPNYERVGRAQNSIIQYEEKRNNLTKDSIKLFGEFNNKLKNLAVNIAETSNKFSQISNEFIRMTGYTGNDVRDSRETIVHDVISQLNRDTGMYYNSEQSYSKMLQIAQQANIGSLEVIEEITRPMLLASESMNLNNSNLASLLSKWYTRYNFSSSSMEAILDDIKGNTAGNNATAEASLQNISKFSNIMGTYIGNDEAKMKAASAAISEGTSRMESIGLNSGYFFDLMSQIAMGDHSNMPLITRLLSGSGIDFTGANELLRSGNITPVLDAVLGNMESITAIGKSIPTASAEYYKKLGLDPDIAFDFSAGGHALLSSEEFQKSVAGAPTMVESVDDLYQSQATKIENALSRLAEITASIQETLGVGIDDMIKIGASIFSLIQLRNIASGLSGGGTLGGAIGGAAGKSILSRLGAYAAPVAGVAAGGLLVGQGISTIFDEGASTAERLLASTGAGLGVGGAVMTALNATNPVGWALLAAGGMAYLGKTIVDDANDLSGNALAVSTEIQSIEESLKKENEDRLARISDLSYAFSQEDDLNEQIRLMKESGLFKEEELQGKAETELQSMIDSYKDASAAMSTVTDSLLKTADRYYTKLQDDQQQEFVKNLMDVSSNQDRQAILSLLQPFIEDEKILEKITKAGATISNSEWKDILDGGMNSAFDKHNLLDQSLAVEAMRSVDGYAGWGNEYITNSSVNSVTRMYQDLVTAATLSKSLAEFDSIMQEVEESGLGEIFQDMYGKSAENLRKSIQGYADGSNYIGKDQLAILHQGESVVPKKYNPNANTTELEMLRAYYQNTQKKESDAVSQSMKEFTNTLLEIKDFLKYWRDENIKRESMRDKANRLSYSTYQLSHYRPV